MQHFKLIGYALLAALCFTSCDGLSGDDEVDEDGLIPGVRQFVSDEVIDGLKELGHPIYGGVHPPDITGTFLMAPMLITGSNLPGDTVPMGTEAVPITAIFVDTTENLNIDFSYHLPGGQVTPASYSVIVGSDCKFTVFSVFDLYSNSGYLNSDLMVTSGCLTEEGIQDAVVSYVLLDDPNQRYNGERLPGQGRIIAEGDGLAERQ
ncbi:MAG: hypothetical protein WA952_03080 [Lewinella sp.]